MMCHVCITTENIFKILLKLSRTGKTKHLQITAEKTKEEAIHLIL